VPRGDVILTPDALIAHCRITLAGYKIPRSFAFVDALPLSAAGKVLKNVLRDAAARDDTTVNSSGAGRAAL
jgi:acyl-CoA synthetase (AMP-forming)/AMP-acid ligase II